MSLLSDPRFPGWEVADTLPSKGRPAACSLFVLRFDAISSLRHSTSASATNAVLKTFSLLEYRRLGLSSDFAVGLRVDLDLMSVGAGVFEGSVLYTLVVDSAEVSSLRIAVVEDPTSPDYVNRAGQVEPHLTQRQMNKGVYQLLSAQTIFFRVGEITVLIRGLLSEGQPDGALQSHLQRPGQAPNRVRSAALEPERIQRVGPAV